MEPSRSAILGVTERGAVRLKGKGKMPLRPETRRRRKTTHPPRPGVAQIRAWRARSLPPAGGPAPPRRPQTEAGGWLVQRCLMAIRRNQAHAQVESARGAGRRLPPRQEPQARPCSPPCGALNRFFTILCMLHYVQGPSPRGRGRTPQRVSIYSPPLAPRLVAGVGQLTGKDRARKGGNKTQTCGVGVGARSALKHEGRARSEGRGGTEADTFRDASNK